MSGRAFKNYYINLQTQQYFLNLLIILGKYQQYNLFKHIFADFKPTFLFFITPIAAIMRFLTVGSCPLRAASNFRSRTGLESLDEIEPLASVPWIVAVFIEVGADAGEGKDDVLIARLQLGTFTTVGMLRSVVRGVEIVS